MSADLLCGGFFCVCFLCSQTFDGDLLQGKNEWLLNDFI